jgi:hypothetical protein
MRKLGREALGPGALTVSIVQRGSGINLAAIGEFI